MSKEWINWNNWGVQYGIRHTQSHPYNVKSSWNPTQVFDDGETYVRIQLPAPITSLLVPLKIFDSATKLDEFVASRTGGVAQLGSFDFCGYSWKNVWHGSRATHKMSGMQSLLAELKKEMSSKAAVTTNASAGDPVQV